MFFSSRSFFFCAAVRGKSFRVSEDVDFSLDSLALFFFFSAFAFFRASFSSSVNSGFFFFLTGSVPSESWAFFFFLVSPFSEVRRFFTFLSESIVLSDFAFRLVELFLGCRNIISKCYIGNLLQECAMIL